MLSTYESCSAVDRLSFVDSGLEHLYCGYCILMRLLLRRYRNYSVVDVFTFCTYIGDIPILSDCVRCIVTYVTV